MKTNWLEKAAEQCMRVVRPDTEAISAELEMLHKTERALTGLEQSNKREIRERIASLETEMIKSRVIAHFDGKISLFDPAPLTWRDEQGFPRLVPFCIDVPQARFGHLTNIPTCIRSFYKDVEDLLNREVEGTDNVAQLTAQFSGYIPEAVRKNIRKSRIVLNQTFLVAEPGPWKLRQLTPIEVDPLVIGWDSRNFWLIDKFDTTTLEEYAASEFTVRP